jgi:hypothetical protein
MTRAIPRVRRWHVRYYDAAGRLVLRDSVLAPTRFLARLCAGNGAIRRTVSLR